MRNGGSGLPSEYELMEESRMHLRIVDKRAIWFFIAFFCFMGYSIEAHAAVSEAKGPYSAIRPLVQIYTDNAEAADGINPQAKPAKGTLQTNNIEIYYQWQPQNTLSVSKVQFYSSAPGKAYVRLFAAEAGKPGKLLAEARFKSASLGWQGSAFPQAVQVAAGQIYYVSYAHEKDIKDYVTQDSSSQAVPFYWNDYNFDEEVEVVAEMPEVPPVLTRVKSYEAQIKLEWNAPVNQEEWNGYEVYRNGVAIGVTKHTYYIDEWTTKPEVGVFTYSIRAVKSAKLKSAFSNALSVSFQAEASEDLVPKKPGESGGDPVEPVKTVQPEQPTPQDNGGNQSAGTVAPNGTAPTPTPESKPAVLQDTGGAVPGGNDAAPATPVPTSMPPDQELEKPADSITLPPANNNQAANSRSDSRSSHSSEQMPWAAINPTGNSGPAPPSQRMPSMSSKRRVLAKSTAPFKLFKSAVAMLPSRQEVEK